MIIVFFIFLISVFIKFLYFLFYFINFLFLKTSYKKKSINLHLLPISIIISARNEYQNLKTLIPILLKQDYPIFEIVVVNDHSSDCTKDLILSFKNQYPNHFKAINLYNLKTLKRNKKTALSIGIQNAKHNHFLFIDADCIPFSNQWIKLLAQGFSNHQIVIGHGQIKKTYGILNKIIRFDNLLIATQYFSFANTNIPYMCVGRNWGFSKKIFQQIGNYPYLEMKSGDDDLTLQQMTKFDNCSISINKQSFTTTNGKNTLKEWITQKQRHISAFQKYKLHFKILLSLLPLSQFFFYLSFIILIIIQYNIKLVLLFFILKLIYQQLVLYLCFRKFKNKKLSFYFLIYEIFSIFFYILIYFKKNISIEKHTNYSKIFP